MVVLHYIDKFDISTDLDSKFIKVLCNGMSEYAESHIATKYYVHNEESSNDLVHIVNKRNGLIKTLYVIMPKVVHVHGCWSYDTAKFLLAAKRRGFYTVWSPHGGLQSWTIKNNFYSKKLSRIILYQFIAAHRSDMIHTSGIIEEKNVKRLRWNRNVTIIKNSLVTQEITIEQMCKEMATMYQNIIDRHINNEIGISTQKAFFSLIKAGLTRANISLRPGISIVSENERKNFTLLKYEDWRNLSIFADKKGMNYIISQGLNVLGIENVMNIPHQVTVIPSDKNINDITSYITELKKKVSHKKITLKDMATLYSLLRYNDYNEDELIEKLKQENTRKFMGRLESILIELFDMEEGFLPVEAINDHQTTHLKNIINK